MSKLHTLLIFAVLIIGYLFGFLGGQHEAKRQAIKEGVAYYHPTTGNIVFGIADANAIGIELKNLGGKK